MPATCQCSSGSSASAGSAAGEAGDAAESGDVAVDARDLEQRDGLLARVGVAACGLEQRGVEDGAERGGLGRERLRQPQVAVGDEGRRVRLGVAGADEDVLDLPAQALLAGQPPEHRVAARQRERDLGQLEARDLLDQVDLARHVARAPGRHAEAALQLLEADPAEDLGLLVGGHLEPEQLARTLRPQPDHRRLRQLALHVLGPGPARAAQLDDQLRRVGRRRPGHVRVDALLPAVRALGAQRVPLGAAQDPDRLEVRRLEQDVRRRGGDLGLLAAHDPGEPDRALAVGDHEILRAQRALDAVERPHLLALARAARDEPAAEQVEVVGVERAAEREHHVVRDVDDVRDRAHAGVPQPRLQPERRLADRDVAEDAADEAQAALGIVDPDADRLVAVLRRVLRPASAAARRRGAPRPRARRRRRRTGRRGSRSPRGRAPRRRAAARRRAASPPRARRRGR